MRQRVLMVLLWLGLLAPVAAQGTWVRYTSPGRDFSALFPTAPARWVQTSTTGLGRLTTHLFECRQRRRSFLVAFTDYPQEQVSQVNLQETLNRLARLPALTFQGKVLAARDIAINGYPGKEVDFQARDITGRYRAYLVHQRFYYLAVVVRATDQQNAEIIQFLSSFRLLKS